MIRDYTYVIDANEFQWIYPWNQKSLGEDNGHGEGDRCPDEILHSVLVHLGRQTEYHDRRLERHEHRDRSRQDTEFSVAHDELLGGPLFVTGHRMIDTNAERDDEESGENDVIGPL